MVRVLPVTCGAVTATASSAASGYAATRAFDEDADTDWRSNDYSAESWLQGALTSAQNVDSVKVFFREAESGSSGTQNYVRAIRIRPSEHEDTTKTVATICEELVVELLAHSYNRAYVFASTADGFFFDNGQSDYVTMGSDSGDFLKAFITAATAESIEVFASLFYLQGGAECVANDYHLEYENGGNYNNWWMCPVKDGVTAWMTSMITILTTDSDYSGLTGIDFAEPQYGYPRSVLCWCSECQAAFATDESGETFGLVTATTPSRTTATGTAWEVWRALQMTTALTGHIKEVKDAGLTCSVVSFYGIDTEYGELLDIEWKGILEGLDTDAILDDTNKPDEWGYQITWQERAASAKDYTSFSPEWTEYGVRLFLAFNNGRATPIFHIGAYGTNDGSEGDDPDFAYGDHHTLTAAELQEAFEAALRGGALHLDSYALHVYQNPTECHAAADIWDGWDDAIAGTTYNSILCEVQYDNGGTWETVGHQACFRTRGSGTDHTAHFVRKTEDKFRILLRVAPNADRKVYIKEVELRYHSIHDATAIWWGGMDFDNKFGGLGSLCMVRYTAAQAYLHVIDPLTGLDVGSSPYSFDNSDVQFTNSLCVLPTGDEPRLLLQNQGYRGSRATLHRYSTSAPGTLVKSTNLYVGHYRTAYGGIAYQPASVNGTAYLVIAVNTLYHGPRLYWVDPTTLVEAGHSDSEIDWFWANSLCWADTVDNEFVFCENTYGGFVMRPVGLLAEATAASDSDNVVTWDESEITLTIHPEEVLHLSTTSINTPWRITCYVWVNGSTYLAPSVVAYGVAPDGVETLLGTLSQEGSWGNVRLLSLFLGRDLAAYQQIKLVVTRAGGATYIGILEVGINMAITVENVMDAIALGLNDPLMDDFSETELRQIAKDALLETIVAGNTHKEDVSVALVEDQVEYSAEPCHAVKVAALGGQALEHIKDGDKAIAAWDSAIPGIPESYRQETGATIRINPKPSLAALGMIGDIEEDPSDGGTGYEEGDILTVVQSGASRGQVKVKEVSAGVVTKLQLIMRDRVTRGRAYSAASALATTGGSGKTDCTIEIASLAQLEITGYGCISEPTSDSDPIVAIPEHYIRRTVVALGIAMALENRRDGDRNLPHAEKKRLQWEKWVDRMDASLRGR